MFSAPSSEDKAPFELKPQTALCLQAVIKNKVFDPLFFIYT